MTVSSARVALFFGILASACSSSGGGDAPSGAAGSTTAGGSTAAGGSAGATTGASAGTDTVAGSAGEALGGGGSAAGGSAGATTGGGGSAGSAGSAGEAPGITCDPGTTGNGTFDQPGPYVAAPETVVKTGVPVGTLSALTSFKSTIYGGQDFPYQVYVPAQYVPGKRAAFMMVQDGPSHYIGKNSDAKFFANKVLDNLIAEGTIPVTIGLFVEPCVQPCEALRRATYDDATDKYARMVTEELLPAVIEGKYSIVEDPEAWLTVGFSAGAEQGFTVMWNRPVFHRFIGHNTSFPAAKDVGADYIQLVPQAPNKGFRVSLVSGTNDLSDSRGNWLEASTQMTKVLTEKGYPVRFMKGTGGHYPPDQSSADFPSGLRWIWQGCKLADY